MLGCSRVTILYSRHVHFLNRAAFGRVARIILPQRRLATFPDENLVVWDGVFLFLNGISALKAVRLGANGWTSCKRLCMYHSRQPTTNDLRD